MFWRELATDAHDARWAVTRSVGRCVDDDGSSTSDHPDPAMSRSENRPVGSTLRRRPLLMALGLGGFAGYARLPSGGHAPQVTSDEWRLEAKLAASDAAAGAFFGAAVALAGDRALVGARWDSRYAPGAGAAYLFERDATSGHWVEVAKFVPSDARREAQFGASVALDGPHALVGAPDSSVAAAYAGAAYVFSRRDDGTWPTTEDQVLTATDAGQGAAFGTSVALDGGRALIGAPGTEMGIAYAFEQRADGGWPATADATLVGPDGAAGFGTSVALDGGLALVGGSDATLFSRRADGDWIAEGTLAPTTDAGDAADGFGFAVALDGTSSLVGAPFDGDAGDEAGAAYAFSRSGVRKFTPADPVPGGFFGRTVALDGPHALVGAPGDVRRGTAVGEASVFDITADRTAPRYRLTADGVAPDDGYGWAVALDDDRALVSAGADDEHGPFAGAVYVFAAPSAETATAPPTPTATPSPATATPSPTARPTTAPSPTSSASPPRVAAAGLIGLVTGVAVDLTSDEGVTNLLAILAFLFGGGGVVQLLLTGRSDAVAFLAIALAVGVLVGTLLGHAIRRSGD